MMKNVMGMGKKFKPGDRVNHPRRGVGIVIEDDNVTSSMEESTSMNYNRVVFGGAEIKKKKIITDNAVIVPSYKLSMTSREGTR